MRLLLKTHTRDSDLVDVIQKPKARRATIVWGALHVDAFHEGERKPIYDALQEHGEAEIEVTLIPEEEE